MNRRQKKKQFKKKYGMNPKEYERYMQEHKWEMAADGLRKAWESFGEAIKQAAEAIGKMWNAVKEHPAMAEAIEKIRKEQSEDAE